MADAPPAPAGFRPTFTVMPSQAVRGEILDLRLHFFCSSMYVSVTSSAFSGSPPLFPVGHDEDGAAIYTGTGSVSRTAALGEAAVTARCAQDQGPVTAKLRVVAGELVHIVPSSGSPGQRVTVHIACPWNSHEVTSPVLTMGKVEHDPAGQQWAVRASGSVNADAKPGTYRVETGCFRDRLSGTFTVVQPEQLKPSPPGPVRPTPTPASPGQVAPKPKGAVQTGGGGTAEQ